MKNMTIISNGTSLGTKVFLEDGTELTDYVTRIELECEAGEVWTGSVNIMIPEIDVTLDLSDVLLNVSKPFEEEICSE